MLVIAASTDKLALVGIRTALVYFFSNILLNSAMQGKYSLAAIVPSVIITAIVVGVAKKSGQKKSFVISTWVSMILLFVIVAVVPFLAKPGFGMGVIALLILICV